MKHFKVALLAVAVLVATVLPAAADPISAAVAYVASWFTAAAVNAGIIGSSLVAAEITFDAVTALAYAAIAAGLQYVEAALRGGPAAGVSGNSGKISASGITPRAFMAGYGMTAGRLAYVNTWGKSGKTPNAYLSMVIALSDLPVDSLQGLIVNDNPATYGAGTPDSDLGYPIPEFFGDDDVNHLWVKFYDGTQTSADPHLVATFGSDPNFPYPATRVGKGVSYVVVTASVAPKLFSGFPTFKFILNGAKFYDPRLDSTVSGGAGSQRFDDQTTWGFTQNPKVVEYNILRGITYAGAWFYGLQNLAATRLPLSSWFVAMNECDTEVGNNTGGTEPQYRCGGEISVNVQPADAIAELEKCCNGRLAEIGGYYKTHCGAPGTASFSFTDGDLLTTDQQTFDQFPALSSLINAITASYPDPTQGWEMSPAPGRYNDDLEEDDGNRELVSDVQYSMVPWAEQVQRLQQSALDEARRFRKHTIPLPPAFWQCEPLDFGSWSSERNGYENKLFRIDLATDRASLDIILVVTEVDPSDYDWDPSTDFIPTTSGTLIVAHPASQAMVGWAVAPTTIDGDDDRQKAGIVVSWGTEDIDDVDGVIIEIRLSSTSAIVWSGETPHSVEQFKAGEFIPPAELLSDTAYEVRGQYRPISFRDVTWSSWLPVTTFDIRISALEIYDKAISRAKLDDGLQSLNDFLGQSARDLIDQLAQVSQSVAETGLGTSTDIQVLRRGLKSNYDQITAEYSEVILVATGPDSAIVQSIETLSASIGGFASATDLFALTARVDDAEGDISANAEAILGLDATVGNVSASGLFRVTVEATPSGYDSRIGLSASGTSGGATSAASIYIDAKSGSPSRIMLVADQVSILDGSDSAALSDAFLFDSGTLYLKNATIVNLTVDNLEYGAATNMHSATGGSATISDGNWHTVATSSLSTIGGRVLLIAQAQFNTAKTGSPFWDYGSWQLLMDGNLVQDGSNYAIGKYAVPTSDIIGLNYAPNTFMFAFTPAAGSHSFALQVNRQGSSTISVIAGFMQSLESRR